MKKLLLLDSNIIIGIANNTIDANQFNNFDIAISVVTVMEVYALSGMSKQEEVTIDELLRYLTIIPITAQIAKHAGILARTKRHKADLLIAATALELGIPLSTYNSKDFKRIEGLEIFSV